MKLLQEGQGRSEKSLLDSGCIFTICFVIFVFFFVPIVLSLLGCDASGKGYTKQQAIRSGLMPYAKRALDVYKNAFSAETKTPWTRNDLPRVVVCKDIPECEKLSGKASEPGMELEGRCVYDQDTIYIIGDKRDVLYHELGHWFFGTSEETADKFSDYCMGKDGAK